MVFSVVMLVCFGCCVLVVGWLAGVLDFVVGFGSLLGRLLILWFMHVGFCVCGL